MPPRKVAAAAAAPTTDDSDAAAETAPAAVRPPKHTVPVQEHPGYEKGGSPAPTANGPRPQDPRQTASQDPDLDYSSFSDPAFGPLHKDEELA